MMQQCWQSSTAHCSDYKSEFVNGSCERVFKVMCVHTSACQIAECMASRLVIVELAVVAVVVDVDQPSSMKTWRSALCWSCKPPPHF